VQSRNGSRSGICPHCAMGVSPSLGFAASLHRKRIASPTSGAIAALHSSLENSRVPARISLVSIVETHGPSLRGPLSHLRSANHERVPKLRRFFGKKKRPQIVRMTQTDFAAEALIRVIRVIRGPIFPSPFFRVFRGQPLLVPASPRQASAFFRARRLGS
jgi:hypothetical protein